MVLQGREISSCNIWRCHATKVAWPAARSHIPHYIHNKRTLLLLLFCFFRCWKKENTKHHTRINITPIASPKSKGISPTHQHPKIDPFFAFEVLSLRRGHNVRCRKKSTEGVCFPVFPISSVELWWRFEPDKSRFRVRRGQEPCTGGLCILQQVVRCGCEGGRPCGKVDIAGEDWEPGELCYEREQARDSGVWVVVWGASWSLQYWKWDSFFQCCPGCNQLPYAYSHCGFFHCYPLWNHWKGELSLLFFHFLVIIFFGFYCGGRSSEGVLWKLVKCDSFSFFSG